MRNPHPFPQGGALVPVNFGPAKTVITVKPTAVPVALQRANIEPTRDQALWVVLRNSAEMLSFERYANFIEPIMGRVRSDPGFVATRNLAGRRALPFPDAEPYRLLKVATEVFMMANCGVNLGPATTPPSSPPTAGDVILGSDPEEESLRILDSADPAFLENQWNDYVASPDPNVLDLEPTLPYLYDIVRLKLGDVPRSDKRSYGAREHYAILRSKLTRPILLELIWNYWHEEGMLVQTMNALSWRFQNRRGMKDHDPLAMLEIDPLRGLNNLLWGWVQDEQHRLTIARRGYEYDHEYGLRLVGKAAPSIRGADSRSRFLEGFHQLLQLCSIFYKEDDDTTVVADGFPVLNALREVHLQLTQGAHNQYGDLPWTARQEFLMQQWIVARPEMREFLPRRIMVDYPEAWMDSVETMKSIQGWTDSSILHFRDLGIFGEKILLSVRFGAWTSQIHPENAANWARYWRPEIQGYVHSYRAVTGVDLTDQADATIPAVLLQRRLPARSGGASVTGITAAGKSGAQARVVR
jgi:hypothetical protein